MFLIFVNIESVGNLKYTSDLQPVTSLKNELLRRYLLFLFFWKNIYFMEHLMFISCKTKLKKNFFFWKNICFFLQNIHYLQKKIMLYGKMLLRKLFLQKMKKIYLIWEIFFYPENIYSFCKKIFLIIKNIFVKTSWWTQ